MRCLNSLTMNLNEPRLDLEAYEELRFHTMMILNHSDLN